jgi:hypothetical protein
MGRPHEKEDSLRRTALIGIGLLALSAATASAQVTQAAGSTPPDDTPSVKVGATIYPNFVYQTSPQVVDADGNTIHKNSFDVSRAYINITGNISHLVAFRVTPDITRENDTASSLAGSLVLRVKYAFLQTNFDEWMTKGSYARFGIQQTPYLDYTEGVYRYRFQGTMFVERNGYFASADAGASFHYNLPSNYGDFHVGLFNGENYNKAEVNDQKAFMVRASIRPFAKMAPVARGLRATIFFDGDNYIQSGERKRLIGQVTFEHTYLNAGFEYLDAHDQTSALPGSVDKEGKGWSIWATPKSTRGWEMLLRYDHLVPDERTTFAAASTAPDAMTPLNTQEQNRTIVGVAYWFPHQGSVSSALMLDYDGQQFQNLTAVPTKAVGVHALINF